MIGVGLIEETSKLIIPLVVLIFFARYRKQADGLLIGVAAGAGFAALETMGYAFVTLIQSKGSITDTVDVLLLRGIMSPPGTWRGPHLGHRPVRRGRSGLDGPQDRGFVGAFVLAVALHTAWDSQRSLIGTAIVAVVSLAALGWTVHRISHPRAAAPTG